MVVVVARIIFRTLHGTSLPSLDMAGTLWQLGIMEPIWVSGWGPSEGLVLQTLNSRLWTVMRAYLQ